MSELSLRRRAPRILIVDDNPDNLILTRELLSSRGYDVTTATNADAAQAAIRAQHPDLIMLDVIMPGKTGYELCHELKEDAQTRLIPVVMLTALVSNRETGPDGTVVNGGQVMLAKPVSVPDLIRCIERQLAG